MSIFIKSLLILSVMAIVCGCASPPKTHKDFLKEEGVYVDRYRLARTREDAINIMRAYLERVDAYERGHAKGVRFNFCRALAETRIAILYEELGDQQQARAYMERALRHVHGDPFASNYDEAKLRAYVKYYDDRMSPAWRKNNG